MGLGKGTMTSMHHYGVIQSSFTALKTFCAPPVHPSIPRSQTTPHLFTISTVLSHPECPRAETMGSKTFLD